MSSSIKHHIFPVILIVLLSIGYIFGEVYTARVYEVIDTTKIPIDSAFVEWQFDTTGVNGYTDINGKFSVVHNPTDSCSLSVCVSKPGYVPVNPASGSYNVICSEQFDFNFKLAPADGELYIAQKNSNSTDTIFLNVSPNPFNMETMFNYTLTDNSEVVLSIFNTLGQKVFSTDLGYLTAGSYTYSYNMHEMQSGVYFCRFETKNGYTVRKILLIK